MCSIKRRASSPSNIGVSLIGFAIIIFLYGLFYKVTTIFWYFGIFKSVFIYLYQDFQLQIPSTPTPCRSWRRDGNDRIGYGMSFRSWKGWDGRIIRSSMVSRDWRRRRPIWNIRCWDSGWGRSARWSSGCLSMMRGRYSAESTAVSSARRWRCLTWFRLMMSLPKCWRNSSMGTAATWLLLVLFSQMKSLRISEIFTKFAESSEWWLLYLIWVLF